MSTEARATYLQDHLAGPVAALELLAHLGDLVADRPLAATFTRLQIDIVPDQQELEALLTRLQIAPSRPRQALVRITRHVAECRSRNRWRQAHLCESRSR